MSAPTKNLRPACQTSYQNDCAKPQQTREQALAQALKDVHALVPPLWPLRDYVAVNPFAGMADQPFLNAAQGLGNVRDCDLLMPQQYFQDMHAEGKIPTEDLSAALKQCREEYPCWFQNLEVSHVIGWLETTGGPKNDQSNRIPTIADALDTQSGSTWSSHILNDITRHCSSHYDEVQSIWPSPWNNATLYSAWREASIVSRRMNLLGLDGFREFVMELPGDPKQVLMELLTRLEVPTHLWTQLLLAEAFSISGWASFVRYRVREAEMAGGTQEDLTGLLAIRLAYDAGLARKERTSFFHAVIRRRPDLESPPQHAADPGFDILARYLLQVATERKFKGKLFREIASKEPNSKTSGRKKMQMVFCIDVRSEVFRRNLEAMDESIETMGFAGFFGIPLEYFPVGSTKGVAQCPVLLKPTIRMHEAPVDSNGKCLSASHRKKVQGQEVRSLWEGFKKSATTCFSFVESIGLAYIGKLLSDSVLRKRVNEKRQNGDSPKGQGYPQSDNFSPAMGSGFDLSSQVQMAENLLRNLGLINGFSRVVIFCGHTSAVTNNPYQAALDCGACGGHSGEPNARFAAGLLNNPEVREGLKSRGIEIPEDTRFIPAIHNTTTDEVTLLNGHEMNSSLADDLTEIQALLQEAGKLSRVERKSRFASDHEDDFFRRSHDWSEVRPEWGLAGNAAFIIAPRSRTSGLNLGGRAFLHGYDHRQDPDLRVLELIMTAPMVVTNWINLQYYASTVDPKSFGSGNKVLHNVVGGFGILQGNGGDLMTGLPLQCVHDGKNLQHDPLRLTVIIEAPCESIQTIINRHSHVANLVTNGWISLHALDQDRFFHWDSCGQWQEEPLKGIQ